MSGDSPLASILTRNYGQRLSTLQRTKMIWKSIFVYFFVTARAQLICDPFELKCSVNEFIIRVIEPCLNGDIPIESISINYRNDEACKVKTVEGTNQKEIRFLYSSCGVIPR